MAPDQGPVGSSTAFSTSNSVITHLGMTALAAVLIEQEDKGNEQQYEQVLPTWWTLQCKRYDRINADRKYLSEVARAKRHFGFKKPVKKHSGRRHKR